MSKPRHSLKTLFCCYAGLLGTVLALPAPPTVQIQSLDRQSIQVSWPGTAAGFVLEESTFVGTDAVWREVAITPQLNDNRFTVSRPASSGVRFFRLREPPFTTIRESSPGNGETDVAVLRETIVRFSAPLAANSVVSAMNFYAVAGPRRFLSRAELSTDRRTATLFYLEPLTGSTRVEVIFDGEGMRDALDRPLDPDGNGLAGGKAVIAFETLSLTPLAGTAVLGRVFASELVAGTDTGTNAVNRPLEGVTITVDGMEETLRTKTDAMGNFKLEPAPPGRFFVHIDGRTAKGSGWPDGDYYPAVGKQWEAVAGRTDNLAGGNGQIFLPLIRQGTLQPVSQTQDTTINFPAEVVQKNPALEGVSITVPANSLFSENGTRGGKVGIAPVPPDRLPSPLPPGLEMPIVITVQTDGALNFDRPAPLCFPNLTDPVLKTPLPPNSKQSLISFNHDKGIWEGVGSMTVSADGKMICTDPGVGILQPGWHGVGPPGPEKPPLPPCGREAGGPTPASLGSSVRGGAPSEPALLTVGRASGEKDPACLAKCESDFDKCILEARTKLAKRTVECLTTNQNSAIQLACIKVAADDYDVEKNICKYKRIECRDECKPPPPPPPPPPPAPTSCKVRRKPKPKPKPKAALMGTREVASPAPSPQAATVLQIGELLDQVSALAAAHGPSAQWPPEIATQVLSMVEAAHSLAGGDAGRYLDNYLLDLEVQADFNDEIDEPDGNAPPYPVLYAAEVLRPGGLFYLRGETEPYGQYGLFVPRDGTLLSVHFYDPKTKTYDVIFPWRRPNAAERLPSFTLFSIDGAAGDLDRDGLPDPVELVYGTDRGLADSDGDGLSDGTEVENGTNPLDGRPMNIGVVATVDTPGTALDVCAANNLAIVADGATGVSIFNIFDALNPVLIRQLDTPGRATAVASDGRWAAVADEIAGVAIIDLSNPAEASIHLQIPFETVPRTVAVADGVAYVGLKNGDLQVVEMASGDILAKVALGAPVADLAVAGDQLYIITGLLNDEVGIPSSLLIYDLIRNGFNQRGSLGVPRTVTPLEGGRLFVGGGLAYLSGFEGYSVIDVSDPGNPRLIGKPPTT
ncbi:MAG: hypothetical protein L0Z50_35460, partial [Verrucomicrobiales bacterium]|nr:hypothetical protein [Verrucomicrobiales bacterium]